MSAIETYFQKHRDRHIEEMKAFLRIPSISSLSEHRNDIHRCAEWTAQAMKDAGLQKVDIMESDGHPVVYGEWLELPDQPTVLIYGHYDVQPVDPLELWQSKPFEPEIREEKLYARGASDDKGQVFMHIKAVQALLETEGHLPVNVKFCIEGEEEIGSPNLDAFVERHRDKLKADALLVSDTPMLEKGKPAICYGLRGLCGLQIDVKGPDSDLHSGLYGGAIQNPIHALSHILASMHDVEGRVAVDGFYDVVEPPTPEERENFRELSNDEALLKQLGVPALFGEKEYTAHERIWARPTLEVNGIYGGFQGEGIKTVIPSTAHAKITCRLIEQQDPDDILQKIEAHIQAHQPPGVTVSSSHFDKGKPFKTPYDHPAIKSASAAYEHAYGVPPAYIRMGGSIPIVETFGDRLDVPVVLMGFGLPEENFHAPNEHFHLENFDKGLRALCTFHREAAQRL